ncbi:hypothetical protein ACFUGD_01860 [Streptomyces sp. NPDC057217]|uniref:hypothetical protein n=1 Tax=Streptomyces sp. NPDC057217 TaxID=3346054 RepID=UPI003628F6BB
MSNPIHPTRIIPAGAPPAPPVPPAHFGPPAPRPPDPGPLDIHVTVVLPGAEPGPTPSWWQRLHIRWVYNAGCLVVALPLSQPWRTALIHVRDEQSLIGAWTLAAVPLVVVGMLDNARRIEAAGAHPDLWRPKIRAALTRIALWALVIATVTALPVETVVYLLTGVRT